MQVFDEKEFYNIALLRFNAMLHPTSEKHGPTDPDFIGSVGGTRRMFVLDWKKLKGNKVSGVRLELFNRGVHRLDVSGRIPDFI